MRKKKSCVAKISQLGEPKDGAGGVRRCVALKIPGELPNLNQVISQTKKHWSTYANLKRIQTRRIALMAIQLQPVAPPVQLVFHWTTKDLRVDPDNTAHACKYILDGLVEAGVLPDDNRKTIKEISHRFPAPDKKNPNTVVEIFSQ